MTSLSVRSTAKLDQWLAWVRWATCSVSLPGNLDGFWLVIGVSIVHQDALKVITMISLAAVFVVVEPTQVKRHKLCSFKAEFPLVQSHFGYFDNCRNIFFFFFTHTFVGGPELNWNLESQRSISLCEREQLSLDHTSVQTRNDSDLCQSLISTVSPLHCAEHILKGSLHCRVAWWG